MKSTNDKLIAVCGVALGICAVFDNIPKDAGIIDAKLKGSLDQLRGLTSLTGADPMSPDNLLNKKRVDRIMQDAGIPPVPDDLYMAVVAAIHLNRLTEVEKEIRGKSEKPEEGLHVIAQGIAKEDLPINVQKALDVIIEFAEEENFDLSITLGRETPMDKKMLTKEEKLQEAFNSLFG